jgi:hypothetical protein
MDSGSANFSFLQDIDAIKLFPDIGNNFWAESD